jgi:hypothetical protein
LDVTSPLVFDLGIKLCSELDFGSDDEIKGETACLAGRELAAIGNACEEPLTFRIVDDPTRGWLFEPWLKELVLRMWPRVESCLSSWRFLDEKNDDFEAVIGVLGVFVAARRGGGVDRSCGTDLSFCKAATFAAVGVLKGCRFKGGSLSGCRFFFFDGVPLDFCSVSKPTILRDRDSGSCLTKSCIVVPPDSSLVDMLLMLLESKGRLDLLLLNNSGSAGDSLGDSYAFGIAGTGGTSSSSFPAELCTFLVFGVGSLEDAAFCGTRGCKDPVDVRAVL